MRQNLEMGSHPNDAPDRPRSSFAFSRRLPLLPDSRRRRPSLPGLPRGSSRSAGTKRCAAHRRTAVRPHRRCRTPTRARRPAPSIALTAARRAQAHGYMEVEAAARRPGRGGGAAAEAAAAAAVAGELAAALAALLRQTALAGALPSTAMVNRRRAEGQEVVGGCARRGDTGDQRQQVPGSSPTGVPCAARSGRAPPSRIFARRRRRSTVTCTSANCTPPAHAVSPPKLERRS